MKREKWNSLTYKIRFSILLTNSIVAKIFKLTVFFFQSLGHTTATYWDMISNPWNLIKGTGYSLLTHRGLRAWEANANGNATAKFKFLFVNAYVCIWICVRVSHSCVSLHLYLRSVFASDVWAIFSSTCTQANKAK